MFLQKLHPKGPGQNLDQALTNLQPKPGVTEVVALGELSSYRMLMGDSTEETCSRKLGS